MPNTGRSDNEFTLQTIESINSLISLSSKIDERVQNIMKNWDDLEKKLDFQIEKKNKEIDEIKEAINKIELKLENINSITENQETRWKGIMNFVIQILWIVLAAYLLTKLNLQAPAIP